MKNRVYVALLLASPGIFASATHLKAASPAVSISAAIEVGRGDGGGPDSSFAERRFLAH